MVTNPYIVGNPVGKTPTFVGRGDILRSVTQVLINPSQSGLVLFGQRRIGKTSLLDHLDSHLHSDKNTPYATVMFDLQDKARESLESVLVSLSETIAVSLGLKERPNLGEDPRKTFRDEWLPGVIQNLSKRKTLTLLFDEFDVLANPHIDQASEAFFPYFRQIISLYPSNLKFIFVLGRNITDINNIALSFLKPLQSKHVSLLSESDTAKLVKLSETLNSTLKWPDEVVNSVWNLTNGHPYLTQALCSQVWESLHENRVTSTPIAQTSDVESAVELTLESSRSMLEWLWDGLGPAERVAASALAEAGPITVSPTTLERILHENGVRVIIPQIKNAPDLLEEWDLIQPVSGEYKFRVELLRQWIQKYKRVSRIRAELNHLEPDADAYYQMASRLYYDDHAAENALTILRKAIARNPYHSEASSLHAQILTDLGKFDEASYYIEQMEYFDPKNARLLKINNRLGMAEKIIDPLEKVELYNSILELDPEQPDAIENRVMIIEDELVKYLKKEQIDKLEFLISSKLLTEQEILKAREHIKEIKEVQSRRRIEEQERIENAKRALATAPWTSEDSNKQASSEKLSTFFESAANFFESAANILITRVICLLLSAIMWAPVLWIVIAIMNSNIVIGKTLGFAEYSTQAIGLVVIMWLITSVFVRSKDFRLEQTCAVVAAGLLPFMVFLLLSIGLLGEKNVKPLDYLLIILVIAAIIFGYRVIGGNFGNSDNDDARYVSGGLSIALNIAILIICFWR